VDRTRTAETRRWSQKSPRYQYPSGFLLVAVATDPSARVRSSTTSVPYRGGLVVLAFPGRKPGLDTTQHGSPLPPGDYSKSDLYSTQGT
jgi:hypothetical protein